MARVQRRVGEQIGDAVDGADAGGFGDQMGDFRLFLAVFLIELALVLFPGKEGAFFDELLGMNAGAEREGVPVDGGEVNRVSRQRFDAVGQKLNPAVVVEHLEQLIFQFANIHRQASFRRSMGKGEHCSYYNIVGEKWQIHARHVKKESNVV